MGLWHLFFGGGGQQEEDDEESLQQPRPQLSQQPLRSALRTTGQASNVPSPPPTRDAAADHGGSDSDSEGGDSDDEPDIFGADGGSRIPVVYADESLPALDVWRAAGPSGRNQHYLPYVAPGQEDAVVPMGSASASRAASRSTSLAPAAAANATTRGEGDPAAGARARATLPNALTDESDGTQSRGGEGRDASAGGQPQPAGGDEGGDPVTPIPEGETGRASASGAGAALGALLVRDVSHNEGNLPPLKSLAAAPSRQHRLSPLAAPDGPPQHKSISFASHATSSNGEVSAISSHNGAALLPGAAGGDETTASQQASEGGGAGASSDITPAATAAAPSPPAKPPRARVTIAAGPGDSPRSSGPRVHPLPDGAVSGAASVASTRPPSSVPKVLFRPAAVVIPERSAGSLKPSHHGSERGSDSGVQHPNTPHGAGSSGESISLSKRFKIVALGLKSMLGASSTSAKQHAVWGVDTPGSGGAGGGDDKGISKIMQRMRSSFAMGRDSLGIGGIGGIRRLAAAPPASVSMMAITGYDKEATEDLQHAVREGDVALLKDALDGNADPNVVDASRHCMVPLHFVAAQGRAESHEPPKYNQDVARQMAALLKRAGARLNAADSFGFTPLQLASFHGNLAVLTFLLQSVGRSRIQLQKLLDHQDLQIKSSALHCAIEGHQAGAVVELLMNGASYRVQDFSFLTPWGLCALHHYEWGLELINELNVALATNGRLPSDAVLQLALELRTLEVVPVVLRAAAKWPSQVWQLMRAAIASGLQEFVELLAEDIPTVCPSALLQVPWGDVMVEMATRFPTSFRTLLHGLNVVDFETVVLPFIRGLNFDDDQQVEHSLPSLSGMVIPVGGGVIGGSAAPSVITNPGASTLTLPGADGEHAHSTLTRQLTPVRLTGGPSLPASAKPSKAFSERDRDSTMRGEGDGGEHVGMSRVKSMISLKSMLAVGNRSMTAEQMQQRADDEAHGDAAHTGLPEAVKYLLLRCVVSSLADLDWRVWQAFVGGLHSSLALEIARFPKLFKRLTDSVAARRVPSWKSANVPGMSAAPALPSPSAAQLSHSMTTGARAPSRSALSAAGHLSEGGATTEAGRPATSRWASSSHLQGATIITSTQAYEAHKLLNVNHLVTAAIASRSSVNVYNVVTAMDRWLELNPSCYLAHVDPASIAALSADYPEACRLLLSLEAQGQMDAKVPGYLCPHNTPAVFRCNDLALGFIWQDDGLVALQQLGIRDLDRVQRWVLSDVTFDTVLKLFKSSVGDCSATETAEYLDTLLNSGLTGKDINKLVQLDTNLADVVDGLQGGLTAGFVHQMLSHKISFQVVTQLLDMKIDRSTMLNNVRHHQAVWSRFPPGSYVSGITYDFIRIFFETWEEYRFDKRFIDLMFDFHDPLFVRLRTALEYVNSGKAINISLADEENAIRMAMKTRATRTLSILSSAFLAQQHFSMHRGLIVTLVQAGAVLAPKVVTKTAPWLRKATMGVISTEPAVLDTAPKIDAISEVLPITNLARLGDKCYLRALLSSGAPASTFGLPVVEALIQAKWTTFGFQFKLLLLCEHMAYLLLTVAYLVLITQWDGLCAEGDAADAVAPPDGAEAFVSCDTGIASLALLVCMLVVCAFQSTVYIRQLHSLGVGMWFASPSNWGSLLTVALQVMVAIGHLQREDTLLRASIAMLVLLQFLRLGWFAILNDRLGALVRIITQTLADTMYFLFLLGIMYVGFYLAFLTLSPRTSDPTDIDPPLTDGLLATKLFTIMLGDIQSDFIQQKIIGTFALPVLSMALLLAYTVLLLIVAFNMLVAIMNDTFNRIKGGEKHELLKLKALVLVDIESGFSPKQLEEFNRQLLGKYLHVLRPRVLDDSGPDPTANALDFQDAAGSTATERKSVRLDGLFATSHGGAASSAGHSLFGGGRPGQSLFGGMSNKTGPSRPGSANRRGPSRPGSGNLRTRQSHAPAAVGGGPPTSAMVGGRPLSARPMHKAGGLARPKSAIRPGLGAERSQGTLQFAGVPKTGEDDDENESAVVVPTQRKLLALATTRARVGGGQARIAFGAAGAGGDDEEDPTVMEPAQRKLLTMLTTRARMTGAGNANLDPRGKPSQADGRQARTSDGVAGRGQVMRRAQTTVTRTRRSAGLPDDAALQQHGSRESDGALPVSRGGSTSRRATDDASRPSGTPPPRATAAEASAAVGIKSMRTRRVASRQTSFRLPTTVDEDEAQGGGAEAAKVQPDPNAPSHAASSTAGVQPTAQSATSVVSERQGSGTTAGGKSDASFSGAKASVLHKAISTRARPALRAGVMFANDDRPSGSQQGVEDRNASVSVSGASAMSMLPSFMQPQRRLQSGTTGINAAAAAGADAPDVIREAQRRVTRMMTRRMTLGNGLNTLLTPAEALQESLHPRGTNFGEDDEEEDEEDDDSDLPVVGGSGGLNWGTGNDGRISLAGGAMGRISHAGGAMGRVSHAGGAMGRVSHAGGPPGRVSIGGGNMGRRSGAGARGWDFEEQEQMLQLRSMGGSGGMMAGSGAPAMTNEELMIVREAAAQVLAAAGALQNMALMQQQQPPPAPRFSDGRYEEEERMMLEAEREGARRGLGNNDEEEEVDLPEDDDASYDSKVEELAPRLVKQPTGGGAALDGQDAAGGPSTVREGN